MSPAEWIDTVLDRRLRSWAESTIDDADRVWVNMEHLLAENGAFVRDQHARICAQDEAPDVVGAKWFTSWYAGRLAFAVGYMFAHTRAAAIVDPDRVRFGLRDENGLALVDLVDLGTPLVAVLADHPWADEEGVRIAASEAELIDTVVTSLRAVGDPLIPVVRTLAKVGTNTLWAEIIDEFGMSVTYDREAPTDPALLDALQLVIQAPGAPWRKRPTLVAIGDAENGIFVGQKGGCCLVYQCGVYAPDRREPSAIDEPDPWIRAWNERYPDPPGQDVYCSSCSLRDLSDSIARQSFVHELDQTFGRRHE